MFQAAEGAGWNAAQERQRPGVGPEGPGQLHLERRSAPVHPELLPEALADQAGVNFINILRLRCQECEMLSLRKDISANYNRGDISCE